MSPSAHLAVDAYAFRGHRWAEQDSFRGEWNLASVRHEEAEAIYDAGREAVVETLLALSARVEELSRTVAEQAARIEGLERRLYRDSQNSSLAPSSDSPMSRQQRPALARERAKGSLRKQGGQPGHEGKARELAAADRIAEPASTCRGSARAAGITLMAPRSDWASR